MGRKLIEVALPLKAINEASAREKSIRHGHPSTLHLWWARRPLAAARAVIFGQLVDDPSEYADVLLMDPPTKRLALNELKRRGQEATPAALAEVAAERERRRLFGILEALVKWENTANEKVLEAARAEIRESWRRACAENADHPRADELFDRNRLPAFHDPFAGGGALPLEAQRLGLEAHASDLNPVAVLINKAMIEIPPKFAGRPPVNPESRAAQTVVAKAWPGATGLAEDVRFYGKWMRDEAEKRIGRLYPKVEVTAEMARERPDLKPYEGRKLTVIAWLWARTVRSPNPAFGDVEVPLASTFMLSTKKGKEAWVEPAVEGRGYRFRVRVGPPTDGGTKTGTKVARGANFRCLMSGTPIAGDYVKAEGVAGRMGSRMLAIVAAGDRERIYLSPVANHERAAVNANPAWRPTEPLPHDPRAIWVVLYGLTEFGHLFSDRQLVALTTFSDLVGEARERIRDDAASAGLPDDDRPLRDGGLGATAYAEAASLYLAFVLSKQADLGNALCAWEPVAQCPRHLFGRQAIPMVWDYAEGNPLGKASGAWLVLLEGVVRAFSKAFGSIYGRAIGYAEQQDARLQNVSSGRVVSTDPPYFDNIGYADLSDFFYVWLRRSMRTVFSNALGTVAAPKQPELVATPYRHGGKEAAEHFFVEGMTDAMSRVSAQTHEAFPTTIFYAFKQSEQRDETGATSTGWETFLEAVMRSGFAITGTWPMRTENSSRLGGIGTNALASSIVLVCRRRPDDAPAATRREFLTELRSELPQALRLLQSGNVAPVDLAQAAIGPGMAVYTRYGKVLDAEGNAMSVREALAAINRTLDEVLAEQEGDFDADTRWALAWFEQFGFDRGDYGIAETLTKAKNTSVDGLDEAGVLKSKGGEVWILRPENLDESWDPETDDRLTVWEIVHHLIRRLDKDGEAGAAEVVAKLGSKGEAARELCYRVYTLCDRKNRAAEAHAYNRLVQSWPEIVRLSQSEAFTQGSVFGEG